MNWGYPYRALPNYPILLICLSFVPIQGEPFGVRAALAAPTYIRPGTTRPKVPHARCKGAGSKGDGTILYRGVFQPCHIHTLDLKEAKILLDALAP